MSCMLFTFLYNGDFFFFLLSNSSGSHLKGLLDTFIAFYMVEVTGLICQDHAHFIKDIKES